MERWRRTVRLSRREVRDLLKEVAVYCCGAAGGMSLGRALAILEACLRDETCGPRLRALLAFARGIARSPRALEGKAGPPPLERMGDGARGGLEGDSWDAL
jgi:hypothetical protein